MHVCTSHFEKCKLQLVSYRHKKNIITAKHFDVLLYIFQIYKLRYSRPKSTTIAYSRLIQPRNVVYEWVCQKKGCVWKWIWNMIIFPFTQLLLIHMQPCSQTLCFVKYESVCYAKVNSVMKEYKNWKVWVHP